MRMKLMCLLICMLLLPGLAMGEGVQRYSEEEQADLAKHFTSIAPTRGLKAYGYDTPVMTQRFGADPWALVYDGRVYLYMTGDVLEHDRSGKVKENSYSQINTLNVVSSADLVNWTDHGWIAAAGKNGQSRWGNNSWAPAVACKEIDGQMRFFVYFANGGNGIGVLTADSPTGPFTDPLGHALISRSTPNCGNVTWLFDPAVLVDEDGSAYLYFGGGIPNGRAANPGTARVVKLGEDMISIDGKPQALDVPFLFEDSGINRIGDTYVYSYCTNWNVTAEGKRQYGFDNAQIAYMTSDSPMGPFTYKGVVLKNPGVYYGCYGNNHHSMFRFGDAWYIAWHSQMLESPLGISGGYRSTNITRIRVDEENASIGLVNSAHRNDLEQVSWVDPYDWVEAETIGAMAGLETVRADPAVTCGNMLLTGIGTGDWLTVYGVDFGDGAARFEVVANVPEGVSGMLQLRVDGMGNKGEIIGYAALEPTGGEWQTVATELIAPVSDVHDLVVRFDGEDYQIDRWRFVGQ